MHRGPDVHVTFAPATRLERPVVVNGRTVLEDGSPAIWFTFPGRWHDIGRFHLAGGEFTGIYGNILTPARFLESGTWETTDLFLDIWLEPDGAATLLDEPELARAEREGWVDPPLARTARGEARAILEAAARGDWPPPIVTEWTLERVRRVIQGDA